MALRNPLLWPPGWQRTEKPIRSNFDVNWSTTIRDLEKLIGKLGLENVEITTNQRLRLDGGLSTAREATPDDAGVAVYFTRNGQNLCIPCDRFLSVPENVRAIGMTLEYIARMERYGTSQMVEAVFTGFKAIPESSIITPVPGARSWNEVLQVWTEASPEIVRAAYRNLSARYHPDNKDTGDEAMFLEVQKAYDTYKKLYQENQL